MSKKYLILILVFTIIAFSSVLNLKAIRDSSSTSEDEKLIEVCSNGIVYVPFGTKYVLCNGKKSRVLRIEKYEATILSGCWCPEDCCNGQCAVIIICNAKPETKNNLNSDGCGCKSGRKPAGSGGDLCTMWLYCGD